MVNYVKRNADSILSAPNRYLGLKIATVLYDAFLSSKVSGTKYVNVIAKYWQNRKSKTIIQNSQGEVIGNEDAITMYEVLKRSRLGAAVYVKQKKTFKQAVQEEQAIQMGQGPRNDFYVHTNSVTKNKWAEMKAKLEPKKRVSPYRSPSNNDGVDQKMLNKAKKRLMDTRGRLKSLETLVSSILESRSGKEALQSANEQLRLAESNLDKELRFKARHPERYDDYKKTEGVISNQMIEDVISNQAFEENSLEAIKKRRRGISPEAKMISSPSMWGYGDINTGTLGGPTISSTSGHTSYKSYTATLKSGIDPINGPEGTEPSDKLPF